MKLDASVLLHGSAGFIAGTVATATVYPLDLVRTRLQVKGALASGRYEYSNSFAGISTIIRNEGWRALYQGLGPALVAAGLSWGSYLLMYNVTKGALSTQGRGEETWVHITSATAAGFTALLVTNPLYVVKTRYALEKRDLVKGGIRLPSPITYLRQIYRESGLAGLYRGAIPSMFAIPQGVVQFSVYEKEKEYLRSLPSNTGRDLPGWQVFCAGALSKIVASLSLYPYQVVRSRIVDIHAPTTSSWEALKLLLRHDGFRALYRGLGAQLIRVTPNSAIALLTYEMVLKWSMVAASAV